MIKAANIATTFLSWDPILYETMSLFRFIVGLGAGGVYPLSAGKY